MFRSSVEVLTEVSDSYKLRIADRDLFGPCKDQIFRNLNSKPIDSLNKNFHSHQLAQCPMAKHSKRSRVCILIDLDRFFFFHSWLINTFYFKFLSIYLKILFISDNRYTLPETNIQKNYFFYQIITLHPWSFGNVWWETQIRRWVLYYS